MVGPLLQFEVRYYARRIVVIAAALLFFLLGITAVQGSFGGSEVHRNAPYVITVMVSLLSLFSIFACTLFCANVVLRDAASKMDAIIFTTAVRRLPYFTVRFAGLLVAVFAVLSVSVLGIAAGSLLSDPATLGPFRAVYFLQPLLVFGFPNVLFSASVLYSTALLTRSNKAVYAAGLFLYVLYLSASILGNSPMLAASALKTGTPGPGPLLADPFGLAAFFDETRRWTTEQRNTQLFRPEGFFLLNRVVWAAFSFAVLALSYRTFRFRLSMPAAAPRTASPPPPAPVVYRIPGVQPHGMAYHLRVLLSQTRQELQSIFRHIPFWVMLALWVFLFAIELKDTFFSGPYGMHTYPLSGLIAGELRPMQPALLLLTFYAAELVTRERAAGIYGLVYSTPVPHGLLWGAKIAALAALTGVFIAANIALGIGLQLAAGYPGINLPVYLSLFYYSGVPLLLFAVLAVFVLTVVRAKYAGMLLCLAAAAVIVFGRRMGIEHYMLRYTALPRMPYADMNGFGHYAGTFNWYMLYWSGAAMILAVLSVAWWHRFRHVFRRPYAALLMLGAFITGATGVYIFRETNITGKYMNSTARAQWQADYEKRYKHLAASPAPVIKKVRLAVDLFPARNRYTVKGSYLLKNETASPVSEVWIGVDPEVNHAELVMPGAVCRERNERFSRYRYVFRAPLQPGDTATLHFSLHTIRNGFVPFNSEHAVTPGGSYIELEKYVPYLGYRHDYETADPAVRQKAGLPPVGVNASTDSAYHFVDFDATLSTAAGEQAVTAGTLEKAWMLGGRQYATYRSSAPMCFMFAVSSARYAVKEDQHRGVQLRICHQASHTANLTAILQAMKDALDYGAAHFRPYPLPSLTLAEIPHYRGAATAYPGIVFSAEQINFLGDFRDSSRLHQAYIVTAHETAHQWWANMLSPAGGPGSAMLTETLAKYTEAMVTERRFGQQYTSALLKADNALYMNMRGYVSDEQPLTEATDQTFVYYQKGVLMMYRLREVLGEKRISEALQRLLARHAYPGAPARPAGLVHELLKGTSAEEAALVRECLQEVVVYDLGIRVPGCKQRADGKYVTEIQVTADRKDRQGKPLPQSGTRVDIALYNGGRLLYGQKHAAGTFTVITDQKPARAVIDPLGYIPDVDLRNNAAEGF